jgi:HD-GYP domain-containing protein (c-di-GMP phosphodiesterase class II)
LLTALLSHLENGLDHSLSRSVITNMRNRMAEELLEPQFTAFPDLRRHTESVAGRAEQFARFLGLSPEEIETTRLVALVHDVGMRVLSYDKLYRKRDLTAEELALLREHPGVSAAMIEPLLGVDVARAVLAHHERFDGGGYPNELRGEHIPLPSRIVAICDAYVVMTDPASYHQNVSHTDALASITRGAGGQFDPELAVRFAEMMANA